jgi:plasmid maintenance system antidote protein VapI
MTGQELQDSLKQVGISRKDFGQLIDVHYRTVSRWIKQEVPIPKVVALLVKTLTSKK